MWTARWMRGCVGWMLLLGVGGAFAWVAAAEESLPEEEALEAADEVDDEDEELANTPFPDTHPIEWGDAEPDDRPLPELWFPVGEEIRYRVYWGRIPVGRSVATTEWVEKYGRTLLSIRLRTRSNRFLDRIYPVDDVIESIIDPHTFLPLRFEINLQEGRYRKHEITLFDYENLIAYWRSETRDRERAFRLEPDTRDLISFSYYLRKVGFTPGSRQQFRVMTDEKIYDLWLEAGSETRVRLPNYGRVPSIEVEPEAAFEGLFVRHGRMTLWVSNDERRILTRMSASIPVASIRMVLQDVRGPGNDSWILDEYEEDDDDDEDA